MDTQGGRGNERWIVPELMFQGSWEPKAIMEKYFGPLGILSKVTSSASGVGSGEGKVVQPEWGVFSKQCPSLTHLLHVDSFSAAQRTTMRRKRLCTWAMPLCRFIRL